MSEEKKSKLREFWEWYNVDTSLPGPDGKPQKLDWRREVLSWTVTVVVALIIAIFVTRIIIIKAKVMSSSMETTMMTGEYFVGNRLAYLFKDPQRGDIILFDNPKPEDESNYPFLKRIIGLPGETVTIRDNHVYINDSTEPLDEPYIKEAMISADGVYEVPEGCYFVMGDNRNRSDDSRSLKHKYIGRDEIVAKAVFTFWPKIKKIEGATYD